QDLGFGHQGAHDLHQSPLTSAELAGVLIGQIDQSKPRQQIPGASDVRLLLLAPPALAEEQDAELLAALIRGRHQQVLKDSEAPELAGDLVRADQPAVSAAM